MLSCIWPLPFLGNDVGGILLLGLGKPEQLDMNESRGGVFYIRIHAIRCLHTYRIVCLGCVNPPPDSLSTQPGSHFAPRRGSHYYEVTLNLDLTLSS